MRSLTVNIYQDGSYFCVYLNHVIFSVDFKYRDIIKYQIYWQSIQCNLSWYTIYTLYLSYVGIMFPRFILNWCIQYWSVIKYVGCFYIAKSGYRCHLSLTLYIPISRVILKFYINISFNIWQNEYFNVASNSVYGIRVLYTEMRLTRNWWRIILWSYFNSLP